MTEPKPIFTTEFDGFSIYQRGRILVCEEKGVHVTIDALTEAIKDINKYPLGHKFLVGLAPDQKDEERRYVHLWRDEFNTHLGCLKEPTSVFNKKFIKLIKHLNSI